MSEVYPSVYEILVVDSPATSLSLFNIHGQIVRYIDRGSFVGSSKVTEKLAKTHMLRRKMDVFYVYRLIALFPACYDTNMNIAELAYMEEVYDFD